MKVTIWQINMHQKAWSWIRIKIIRLWNSRTSLVGALCFNNGWQSPMFMVWNEAQKSNGDREYCLTVDDRLILCELQKVLQPFAEQSELVGSEQPHPSLMPLIITDVKHATVCYGWKWMCLFTESSYSTVSAIPHQDDIRSPNCNTLVDPSEQQEQFDSLFSHTGKCEHNC